MNRSSVNSIITLSGDNDTNNLKGTSTVNNNISTTKIDLIDTEEKIETVFLPTSFSNCSRSDLVALISRMLTFLIKINDKNDFITNKNIENVPNQQASFSNQSHNNNVIDLTRFHSRVPPNISVSNYLIRLTKYSSLEHSVLLSSVYYIDLLSSVYPEFKINSLTIHRFLLAATTVASKGLSDSFCTNSHYAKVGGVRCSELNILETDFLRRINYRIIPRDDNIKFCKLEIQQNQFTIGLTDLLEANIPPEYTHINSGYNVLDIYYKKMVQLVGLLKNSTDKSKKVNYVFQDPNNQSAILESAVNKNNQQQTAQQRASSQKRNYDEHMNTNIENKPIKRGEPARLSEPQQQLISKVPKFSPEHSSKYTIQTNRE